MFGKNKKREAFIDALATDMRKNLKTLQDNFNDAAKLTDKAEQYLAYDSIQHQSQAEHRRAEEEIYARYPLSKLITNNGIGIHLFFGSLTTPFVTSAIDACLINTNDFETGLIAGGILSATTMLYTLEEIAFSASRRTKNVNHVLKALSEHFTSIDDIEAACKENKWSLIANESYEIMHAQGFEKLIEKNPVLKPVFFDAMQQQKNAVRKAHNQHNGKGFQL